jgi:serine racemase
MEQTRKRYAADLKSIMEARKRIAPYANATPVITSSTLDALAGRKLFFKCELLQKGGAFKFRGACNAILSLSEDEAKRGVLTHSRFYHYNHTFTCLPHSTILNPTSCFLPNDAKQKPEASS